MTISTKAREISSAALKLSALFLTAIVCLVALTTEAQASRGDDRFLSRFEREYLRETQLLAKEARMRALEIGDVPATERRVGETAFNRSETLPDKMMRPKNATKGAAAESQAGQSQAANTAGDIAKDMACMAIDYASRFMKNFTTSDGNRWNRHRNQILIPIALLLVLPGAVLTQLRAIMAQGNPVLGAASPLEGIQRGIIAIFLIPGSCLVTNYAIDLGNSLHYSVCHEYSRIIGGDMYRDAMCAEIRAFGVRYLSENEGSLKYMAPDLSPRGNEPFAAIEGRIWGKISDPCTGLLLVPANRDDTVMPQASLATKLGMYTANAGICAGWGMLTAFQMAFFYYLYFAGPIMAALWAWPTQMFKQAFPTWVESCVTLAFWSFLWQVTIALLAMTKSPASSGLYMVTALNVLATTSVKHAFDCTSIMKSAVQAFEMIGSEVASAAGSGGGGGGKGGGKGGKKGAGTGGAKQGGNDAPAAPATPAAPAAPAARPATPVVPAAARVARTATPTVRAAAVVPAAEIPASVPLVLTAQELGPMPRVVGLETTVPPTFVDPRLTPPVLQPLATPAAVFPDPATEDLSTMAGFHPPALNLATGAWDNPIEVSSATAPPAAGHSSTHARNTISSVLGNAIQDIMVYPTSIPHQDPDLLYLENVKAEIQQQAEQDRIEIELETRNEQALKTHTDSVKEENFSPYPSITSTPPQETEMNSNEDPRIAALRDQRFNYPPPPMINGRPAAGFTRVPAGVALTPHQLLSKLQTVTDEATNYAPPPSSGLPSTPPLVPLCGFSRVEDNQNFQPQGEAIVTVVDFTSDLQGQSAPQPRQASLHDALSQVLRQRDAWKQSQPQVKPPVAQSVSDGWWS